MNKTATSHQPRRQIALLAYLLAYRHVPYHNTYRLPDESQTKVITLNLASITKTKICNGSRDRNKANNSQGKYANRQAISFANKAEGIEKGDVCKGMNLFNLGDVLIYIANIQIRA